MSRAATLPRRLRAETALAALGGGVALAAGFLLLDSVGREIAERWATLAVPTGVGVVAFLRHHTPDNRSTVGAARGHLRQSLGLANAVTLVRGLAYAAAAGFLLVPPTVVPWLPALLYGGGTLLDAVDGVIARRVGRPTRLGERLDMGYDTLGFVVAPAVAVAWGLLPPVYLSLAAARYVYRAGVWLDRRRGRQILALPASRLRRPLATWQMAFLSVALVPAVPTEVVHTVAPLALVPSLLVFARDYLAVTGRLPRYEPDGPATPADD
ncbi:MAG: phosphatidylglycerophosphate synthase [halophilic archaeon J07HB67]|nr:MAG: phosphatidylglycerophosphate synthase [halophilic archaeon J07HB67]